MIKLRKGKVIVLGLSKQNIKRLQKNQPIRFNLSELIDGSDHIVYIMAGDTEDSMALSLKRMMETINN